MRLLDKILNIIRGQEKIIFDKFREHLALSMRAIEILTAPECRLGNQCLKKIAELEKRGDEISREISQLLSRGAVTAHALNIIEIMANKIDDVLDEIYVLSKEFERLVRYSRNKEIVTRVHMYITEAGKRASQAIKSLQEIYNTVINGSIGDSRSRMIEIERIEEEVDEMKERMLDNIYSYADNMSLVEFHSAVSITYMMDTVVDKLRDLAELTLLLLISIS
ncbi:MAG: DUF47 family protein [Crenarchaeota archaeon]|nr:DUF47 family protein [Thermoproteota archaeon]